MQSKLYAYIHLFIHIYIYTVYIYIHISSIHLCGVSCCVHRRILADRPNGKEAKWTKYVAWLEIWYMWCGVFIHLMGNPKTMSIEIPIFNLWIYGLMIIPKNRSKQGNRNPSLDSRVLENLLRYADFSATRAMTEVHQALRKKEQRRSGDDLQQRSGWYWG